MCVCVCVCVCLCVCACDNSLSLWQKLVWISKHLWCYLTSSVLSVDIHHHERCTACMEMCICKIEARALKILAAFTYGLKNKGAYFGIYLTSMKPFYSTKYYLGKPKWFFCSITANILFFTFTFKGIVHSIMKIFIFILWPPKTWMLFQIWRNLEFYHLLTSGSSAVNGCRQNLSSNNW